MVIMMENQEYGSVINGPSAPYINTLASTYASATNWYAVGHNSITQYLDLIAGSDQGVSPTTRPPFPGPTLVDELATATQPIDWRAYMEGAPYACYTGPDIGQYYKAHNPFMYFSSITGTQSQCNRVVPFPGSFSGDLNSTTPPPFMFVVPNLCNDMHALCTPVNDKVLQGDNWLKANLQTVFTSNWYLSGGVVIITWDEGTSGLGANGASGGGHIPTLVIAQDTQSAPPYTASGNHYGTLRAIEDAYGVGLLGGSTDTTRNGNLIPAL
jgi:hypothetical protein